MDKNELGLVKILALRRCCRATASCAEIFTALEGHILNCPNRRTDCVAERIDVVVIYTIYGQLQSKVSPHPSHELLIQEAARLVREIRY